MRARSPKASARNSALRALVRREHSAEQLKHKLEKRGYAPVETADALEQLKAAGWQSDSRFAEILVRSRIEQGYGPQRIRHELEQAGVPRGEVTRAIQDAQPDWNALCIALHQRKFGALPGGAAQWQKQYRYLVARGFEPANIRSTLKRDWEPE